MNLPRSPPAVHVHKQYIVVYDIEQCVLMHMNTNDHCQKLTDINFEMKVMYDVARVHMGCHLCQNLNFFSANNITSVCVDMELPFK